MSEAAPFVLTPVDAVDLVYRVLRKLERTGQSDEDVSLSVDSILSQTVFQLRTRAVVFTPAQVEAYDTLVKFVSD